MKTLNNELFVTRNETFTMDKTIENKDGSPYIISKELKNPYFLITISDSKYEQNKRYLYNKWLNLSNFPRFKNTIPIDLTSIKSSENGETKYNSFEQHKEEYVVTEDNLVISGWIKDKFISSYIYDDVFFVEKDGIKIYKYWCPIENDWKIYKCRFTTTFSQNITKNWTGQNYIYSITLVSGITNKEYLIEECIKNNIDYDVDYTVKHLYDLLLKYNIKLIDTFDIDKALANYDVVYPILLPTKITVSSDIRGGL